MTTVARIGVLVPVGNPTVEPEFYRMAPSSVTVHLARFDSPEGTTPGTHVGMEQRLLGYLDAMPTVIPSLAAVHPTVVALAHTSVGFADEPTLVERIAKLAGCPGVTASRAILAAFARLGVRRIALATPYSEAIEALGATYWKAAGLEVVARRRLEGVTNIYDETEARAYELGRQTDMRDAEALLMIQRHGPTYRRHHPAPGGRAPQAEL